MNVGLDTAELLPSSPTEDDDIACDEAVDVTLKIGRYVETKSQLL
jgi:hypothetical protein